MVLVGRREAKANRTSFPSPSHMPKPFCPKSGGDSGDTGDSIDFIDLFLGASGDTSGDNPISGDKRLTTRDAIKTCSTWTVPSGSTPSTTHAGITSGTQGKHRPTFFLSSERLDRLRQALNVAAHQARVAQHGGYGRHVEDALAEIEEAIGDHLARIENALEDDKAEAGGNGEAERARRAYFPHYEVV